MVVNNILLLKVVINSIIVHQLVTQTRVLPWRLENTTELLDQEFVIELRIILVG